MSVLPLMLMYLASQSKGGAKSKAKTKKTRAPKWPTPTSPPPLAAFQARKTTPPKAPSADPGGTSTPLAQLHNAPPSPPPASAIDTAKQAATNAIKARTTALIRQKALSFNPFARAAPTAPATSTALVSQLQTILSNHGVKVVRDGLYGPKTASAWSALARRKGLPPTISREGPQIAKVISQTFEQLRVPPIP